MAKEMLFKIPGGKTVRAAELTAENLDWYLTRCTNPNLRDAARVEAERREANFDRSAPPKTATPPAAPPPVSSSAPASIVFVGAFDQPKLITEALHQAQETHHVVSPAMVVGSLPPGCEIFTAEVIIDTSGESSDIYPIPGTKKVGLDKFALLKIGSAAGVSWDYSRRVDNMGHPHFCAWEAVAVYKQFDGQPCRVPGNVEIDARDGGPAAVKIIEDARRRDGGDGASALRNLRAMIARHAESKAMNRAIANMGVRRSYMRDELRKPFLIARVAFTGRTDDPQLKLLFAELIGRQHLGAAAAIFGGQVPALPGPSIAKPALPEPSHVQGFGDIGGELEPVRVTGTSRPKAAGAR